MQFDSTSEKPKIHNSLTHTFFIENKSEHRNAIKNANLIGCVNNEIC